MPHGKQLPVVHINPRAVAEHERRKRDPDYLDLSTPTGVLIKTLRLQNITNGHIQRLEKRIRALEAKVAREGL